MKICLYVAGMPFDGDTIKSGQSLGGSETAGYYTALELVKRGHRVTVFSNIMPDRQGLYAGVLYMPIGPRSEQNPYGEEFTRYAMTVPNDVLLAQRAYGIFGKKYNSKINLFWMHDLALLPHKPIASSQMWNVDRVLAVSDFHKKQIEEVYNFSDQFVSVYRNGLEQSVYPNHVLDMEAKWSGKTMLYSSRPERGLEYLVGPGGIMEQLLKAGHNDINLAVCGYDNTTEQMTGYYNYLWQRCEQLPNVQNLGPLSKEQLYNTMRSSWLHIYPSNNFEETSCITAMEQQVNGTPFLAAKTGALPETLKDAGAVLVYPTENEPAESIISEYVKQIKDIASDRQGWESLVEKCINKAPEYKISHAVNHLEQIIDNCFELSRTSDKTVLSHLIENSDVLAAKEIAQARSNQDVLDDINKKYSHFSDQYSHQKFYDQIAEYNFSIGNSHNQGNDGAHLSMSRVQPILSVLGTVQAGATVLDYGCCIGQQTIAYARAFPHIKFLGVDISQAQIDKANEFLATNKIDNLSFQQADSPSKIKGKFDLVICSEVLEHIIDFVPFLEALESKSKDQVLITVPSGPMESIRWNHQVKREHVHHFEEADLLEIFKNKNINLAFVFSETTKDHRVTGNWAIHYKANGKPFCKPDYNRKFKETAPIQTLSVCMITKAGSETLGETLKSVKDIADEIIIAIDGEDGPAYDTAQRYGAKILSIPSPLQIGFDQARNHSISQASCDWIMWIDCDEILQWPENLRTYLRNNEYDAYAVAQHHFAAEPAGLLKTDYPARIFRNNKGIRFFGVVHEHPEVEINKGPNRVYMLPQNVVSITHLGYDNEKRRRERFIRNFPLMARDRDLYPNRHLGKFLWIRDLIHMNRFEIEKTGQTTPVMMERSLEAMDIWRKLIDEKQSRMVNDALPYISEASDMITQGKGYMINFGFQLGSSGAGDQVTQQLPSTVAKVPTLEDVKAYTDLIISEKAKTVESKYI